MKKTVHKVVVQLLLSTVLIATGAEHDRQLAKTTAEKSEEFFQIVQEETQTQTYAATGLEFLHNDANFPGLPPVLTQDEHKHHKGFHSPFHKKEKKTSPTDSPSLLKQHEKPISPSDTPGKKKKRLSQQIEQGAVQAANLLDPLLAVVGDHKELVAVAITPLVGSDQAEGFASDITEGAKGFAELGKEIIEANKKENEVSEPADRSKNPRRTLTADVDGAIEALRNIEEKKGKRKSGAHPAGRPRRPSDAHQPDKSLQPIVEVSLTKTPPTQSPLPRRSRAGSHSNVPDHQPIIQIIKTEIQKIETTSGHSHDKETTSAPDQQKPIVSTKPEKEGLTKKIEEKIETLVHHDKDKKTTVEPTKPPVPEVKDPNNDSFIKRHPWLVKGVFTAGIIASIIVALYELNQLPPNIAKMIDAQLSFITTQLTAVTSRQWFSN